MKYGSRTCYGSKVVVKVKVFFVQTGQKLDAHRIGDSGGIKTERERERKRERDLS